MSTALSDSVEEATSLSHKTSLSISLSTSLSHTMSPSYNTRSLAMSLTVIGLSDYVKEAMLLSYTMSLSMSLSTFSFLHHVPLIKYHVSLHVSRLHRTIGVSHVDRTILCGGSHVCVSLIFIFIGRDMSLIFTGLALYIHIHLSIADMSAMSKMRDMARHVIHLSIADMSRHVSHRHRTSTIYIHTSVYSRHVSHLRHGFLHIIIFDMASST